MSPCSWFESPFALYFITYILFLNLINIESGTLFHHVANSFISSDFIGIYDLSFSSLSRLICNFTQLRLFLERAGGGGDVGDFIFIQCLMVFKKIQSIDKISKTINFHIISFPNHVGRYQFSFILYTRIHKNFLI